MIKTSSMGDVLHALPAITDAVHAIPDIEFHWVVEENFTDIAAWHKNVTRVIPVALRRWRKNWFRGFFEWRRFKKLLRTENYDTVLDAQGLLKSALITRQAVGEKHGLDRNSAREPLAATFYRKRHYIAREQHAVARLRELFAKALHYPLPMTAPDYGIDCSRLPAAPIALPARFVVCLHGTTWDSKHYPVAYWQQLITQITAQQMPVLLFWGNSVEKARAELLAADNTLVTIVPRCSLAEIATILSKATAVVAVDTGLSHLSAALHRPTIGLYGATDPKRTGTEGVNQIHLAATAPGCTPCLQRVCT
ncbi:MAG: lipopolysaccharide heptosyltransferase I, partial [Gammaproteobacteria bacterium]|nr:lipopolysaccharide heptosyltransferase I [Gammaproteobacteria bacterium]